MLNRRSLRIKVLQTLYGLERSRSANRYIAEDRLKESFQPDLESMNPRPIDELKASEKKAINLFRQQMGVVNLETVEVEPEIYESVNKAVKDIDEANVADVSRYKSMMLKEVEQIAARYLQLLELFLELRDTTVYENSEKPVYNSATFSENQLLKLLEDDPDYQKLKKEKKISWAGYHEEIRDWKKNLWKLDGFKEYQSTAGDDFNADREMLLTISKKLIFGEGPIADFMGDEDMFWEENKPILKSMVKKTFKAMEKGQDRLELLSLTSNWEDDREFFIELFDHAVRNEDKDNELISAKVKNWDIDRITPIDKIMLRMAINEMLYFRSIPVKVTINEYIEIAKKYSTPKSKQFVNGLLDVIAEELSSKGLIKKSGRGLLDNK